MLRANHTLLQLDLSQNHISEEAIHIAKALSSNSTLTHLNLSHNDIGVAGDHLLDSLRVCSAYVNNAFMLMHFSITVHCCHWIFQAIM